ncbi:hypothetical protein AK88_02951 [Plasmodium fragile]|uniref:Uncharacterized protein n=1 Tax=Plasmodium fragile TaxID=5857 RepID=A0A0D9QK34_PLAFR|nr:uncharacterized protein AK88_02951 [Plasmodium fragile]KJP87394.1 hypothetical protein AK88_02951 [Plasmodium fragile]
MGRRKFEDYHVTRDHINELLNSPNIIYENSDLWDNSIFNAQPSRTDKLLYRIEYMRDGTAIYYKRTLGDFKKMFCCF